MTREEQIREAVEAALDAREAQGFPRYLTDPAVGIELGRILDPPRVQIPQRTAA